MLYEFNGKKYKKASTHQRQWGAKLIAELDLKGNEHILDLGCGDGALSAQLADLVPKGSVIGVDASQSMIDVAQNHKSNNLSFLRKDINSLDFEGEFDLVFSNAALHWIKDHKTLLNRIYRSLRDNGIIRFNFGGEGNCPHLFKAIKSAMTQRRYSRYFSDFAWPWFMPSVGEYKALVQQIPFRDIRVWGENADRYFPNSNAMIKWVEQPSLVPFLKCVAPTDKNTFRDFVVERIIQETLQEDGTCFEIFRRVNVYAKR